MTAIKTSVHSGSLNQNHLKLIAAGSMLVDHAARAFSLSGPAKLVCTDIIGRLAFPLFAFMLVEGIQHTRSQRKYFFRLLLLALLSEIPYNLIINGQWWSLARQNTVFTLLLGMLLLCGIRRIEAKTDMNFRLATLLKFVLAAGAGTAAHLLRTDYGLLGVLSIFVMYVLSANTKAKSELCGFAGAVVLNLDSFGEPGAFLALLPLIAYSGEPGKKKYRFLSYLFYPGHLLLLFLIQWIYVLL